MSARSLTSPFTQVFGSAAVKTQCMSTFQKMLNMSPFDWKVVEYKSENLLTLTNRHQIIHLRVGSVGLEFVSLGLRRDCGKSAEAVFFEERCQS